MFILGHLGVTLGIAVLFFRILKIEPDRQLYLSVLIGAILPDLMDKPIGEILLANSISNGRLFAHTLPFVFFLLLIGTYLYRQSGGEERRIIVLGFASLLHLCEDNEITQNEDGPRPLVLLLFSISAKTECGSVRKHCSIPFLVLTSHKV